MGRNEGGRAGQPLQQTLQFALWEVFEDAKTNMVALYDLAPRFVFDQRKDGASGEASRKIIEREFGFCGRRYRITLKPTQIRKSDGSVEDRYLGEREQIVEEVIRRLAGNRGRLALHGDSKVRFPFTVTEVQNELSRVMHTYSKEEIREAVTLLNEVRLKIEALEDRRAPLLSASAFPVVGMRRGLADDSETFVEFNPLVADAIKALGFMQVNYDLLMLIRDPVGRWLLKRLHVQMTATDEPVQQMSASEIRRDSGMPEWKKSRDLLSRVSRAVDLLRREGMLEDVETEERMTGRRKDDILFTMVASAAFMAEVRKSRAASERGKADFTRLAPGRQPASDFATVSGADAYRLRDARRRLAAAPAAGPAA